VYSGIGPPRGRGRDQTRPVIVVAQTSKRPARARDSKNLLVSGQATIYVYYHLSECVGGPRRVAQGEVIAKLGMTGNAGAPHTHFEIRPGGRTAPAINPYQTLVKIC
jgi:murein DD-endopeptidase MepM/ murein hydrolase activator NlpD